MTIDLDSLERVARAARPGPWQWYGDTKAHSVYLATVHGGRVFVMDFVRWGMTGAQPRFQLPLSSTKEHPWAGVMRSVGELGKEEHHLGPRFEASYRRQFTGIGHPDATHIATFDPTTVLALISRIRELEAER